jgi:hypothetical protein
MFGKRLKNKSWVGKYFIPERFYHSVLENDTIEGIEICNGITGPSCKLFVTYPTIIVKQFIPYDGKINYDQEHKIAFNGLTHLYNTGREL